MESKEIKLVIAEYSEYPGPRYCSQGNCSGEEFYHKKLNEFFAKAITDKSILKVDLDGTAGYASSFLDEAFGNLVFDFSLNRVKDLIKITSNQEPDWKDLILNTIFVDWEERRKNNEKPKKTVEHEEWYRLVENDLVKKIWIP